MTGRPAQPMRPVALFYGVQLMVAQMAIVLVATGCVFYLPYPIGLVSLLGMYAALVLAEVRLRIRNPLSIAVLALSLMVLVVTALTSESVGFLATTAYFGALFGVTLTMLIAGRPITKVYGRGLGDDRLHWATSILWACAYGLALALCLVIPKEPGLFPLLPAILVTAVLGTLWLQFFGVTLGQDRLHGVSAGRYRIRRLPATEEALRPFYTLYLREMQHSIRQGRAARGMALDQMVASETAKDRAAWQTCAYFAAYDGDEMVGTIACRSLHGRESLSDLVDNPINVEALLRHGRVILVRYLSIAASQRYNRDLFQGLLRTAVLHAFRDDVTFILSMPYPSVAGLYDKIGFRRLTARKTHMLASGVEVCPVILNLAHRVACELDELRQSGLTSDGLNAQGPWAERYFKRVAVASLFGVNRAWRLSRDEIAALCEGPAFTSDPQGDPVHVA